MSEERQSKGVAKKSLLSINDARIVVSDSSVVARLCAHDIRVILSGSHRSFLCPVRPCRNAVHGSRASPRTAWPDGKFRCLPVRPELVEGVQGNCDTVSV